MRQIVLIRGRSESQMTGIGCTRTKYFIDRGSHERSVDGFASSFFQWNVNSFFLLRWYKLNKAAAINLDGLVKSGMCGSSIFISIQSIS
ncbi:unnamed protein product [Allacma fusca]|uniref:Uncharacterized protein n=1 Tax=Allacma fusca TaxID=39272 RepID=A0A8J2JFR4_9HEXA|nr:unnamed protein product [Allacma fusca]